MNKKHKKTIVFYAIVLAVICTLTMIGRWYEHGYVAFGFEPFAIAAGVAGLCYYARSCKSKTRRKRYHKEARYANRQVW